MTNKIHDNDIKLLYYNKLFFYIIVMIELHL